ncbi:MAG: transcriptional activator NhaR [Arenicellales bacterium]|nr:transcriptional activator NhaR [Arenicellales bacterium]
MNNLNLKHLRYFWVVASRGSITSASEVLHLTPQTISGQLRVLEESIGAKVFEKSGRNLVLTDTGRTVFSYADEIFRLTGELQDLLEGRPANRGLVLDVGISNIVPKLLAYRVLEPVMHMEEKVRLICHEAPLVDLLADLSVHKLDLVLADSPVSPVFNVKAYNHVLGESGTSFFVSGRNAARYSKGFPGSLDGAPMLMPTSGSSFRRTLDQWLEREGIQPLIVAEFEDRALMKAFGEAGAGVFTSPTAVEEDVKAKYSVHVIARVEDLHERFYAISTERRIKHPAVATITTAARKDLFK